VFDLSRPLVSRRDIATTKTAMLPLCRKFEGLSPEMHSIATATNPRCASSTKS
jgi:hypothetical protein